MGILLRAGGILLIIGTLIFSVGSYAWYQRTEVEKSRELFPGVSGASQGSEDWLSIVPNIGLALMALGLMAVIVVLFMVIRNWLAPKTYLSYGDEGKKLTVSHGSTLDAQAIWQSSDIITILNTVLQVEYSNVVNRLRWANRIGGKATDERISSITRGLMRHFYITCALIRDLGGTPSFGFELPKDETSLRKSLLGQLHKERVAKLGYQRTSELTSDESLREVLLAHKADDEEHIAILEEVLSELVDLEDGD